MNSAAALEAENDKYAQKLEQALDEVNKRDSDLAMLQRRLEGMEDDLDKEKRFSDKLKKENDKLGQVSTGILTPLLIFVSSANNLYQ